MKSTKGIKEELVEYFEHYVVKKKLTLREVESIEKLFEKHGKDDSSSFLERINNLMWNTFCLKDREFGRNEGSAIMDILNEWAVQDEQTIPPDDRIDKAIDLLIDAKLQIDYLHGKFKETGTGNAVISKIEQYLKSIK